MYLSIELTSLNGLTCICAACEYPSACRFCRFQKTFANFLKIIKRKKKEKNI